MRPSRISRLTALAACGAIAASAGSAAAAGATATADHHAAERVSVKWLKLYKPRLRVGSEEPGACVKQPGGVRRCPIAITIKAWVGDTLVDHRCAAEAVLPRPGSSHKPTRTSATCTPVTAGG
jgi:hypothetical protein